MSSAVSTGVGQPLSRRAMLRRLLLIPFLKLAVVLASVLIGWLVATSVAEKYFQHRLESSGAHFEELMARWPKKSLSASARRLEELASPLGLEIATGKREGRARPSKEEKAAVKPVLEALSPYIEHLLMRADDETPTVPEAVTAFIDQHRERFLECRRHLLVSKDLTWEWEPDKLLDGPLPGLLGILQLEKLLLVQAIEASRRGDRSEMLSCLEAIHRLDVSILRRPELIDLLIAVAGEKMLHRLVRTLPDVPPEWSVLLRGVSLRRKLMESLRMEAAIGWAIGAQERGFDLPRASRWLVSPYLAASGYEHAERMLRVVDRHRALSPCELTSERLKELWRNDSPRWNIFGKNMWPNLEGATSRVLRMELEEELTGLVLRRRAGEVVPPHTPSSVCREVGWLFEAIPDGRFMIRIDRRLDARPGGETAWPLPLRFEGRRGN